MHVHLSCEAERRNTFDGKKDNTAFATLRARYMFLLTFSLAFFVNTHCIVIYYFHYLSPSLVLFNELTTKFMAKLNGIENGPSNMVKHMHQLNK